VPLGPSRTSPTRARALGALAVLLIAAAGCTASSGSDADLGGPTFSKVSDDSLRATEPKSNVDDLVPPTEEGGAWTIVGSTTDPTSGRPQPAVWRSGDGRAWERRDVEGGSDAGASMAAATYVGDSLLVAGQVARDGDSDRSDAALWTPDGNGWSQVTPAEMGGEHDQWAFDVVSSDAGTLVAGGEIAWGDVRPRLWFSSDGDSWSSVDGGPGAVFDETGEESIQAISPVGDGFVAVGWRDVDGELDGVAWYSPDGQSWERVDAPSIRGAGRQSLQSLTTVDGTLVAGGFLDNGPGPAQPTVWRSEDGQSWGAARGPLPLNQDNRNASSDLSVRSITVSGTRLLASGGNQWRPHMWISDNQGMTWNALPSPIRGESSLADGVALDDAATVGDVTVALGHEPTVLQFDEDRWVDRTGDAFPSGGAQPAASAVVVEDNLMVTAGYRLTGRHGDDRDRYKGNVWLRHGDDITQVQPTEDNDDAAVLEAGAITDVARYNGGYVAVGVEDFASANRRTLEREPQGLLWTSENGQAWRRRGMELNNIDPEVLSVLEGDPAQLAEAAIDVLAAEPLVSVAPLSGAGTRSLEAVAPIGNGFVAVGSVYRDGDGNAATSDWDTDPIVAVSPDGEAVGDETATAGLGGPGTQRFHDVCTFEGRAVAVGTDDSGGSTDVAIRVRDTAGGWHEATATDDSFAGGGTQEALACSAGEDGFLVVGSDSSRGNSDARVWFSRDGGEWEQLAGGALGGSGDQEAVAVTTVPEGDGGWLVGGSDAAGDESDAALWRVLPSGEVARRDHGETSFGGPGTQAISDVAVTGNRAIAVGQDRTSVGMWVTSDLDR
jgi:hypothetical protein